MTDTTITIHTSQNGSFDADALTGQWPTFTRGSTIPLRFWFDHDKSDEWLIVEDGESFNVPDGDTVTRYRARASGSGSITVQDSGSLVIDETGFNLLLEYVGWADAAAYGQGLDHRPYYREQHPESDVTSIVLGVEPSQDLRERGVRGFWGVLTSGSDERNSALTNYQLGLEFYALAYYTEYETRLDLENDLEK